jgi:diguanylate cyclase (GGDEF)-like protein
MNEVGQTSRHAERNRLRKAAEAEFSRGGFGLHFGKTIGPIYEADQATARTLELSRASLSGVAAYVCLVLLLNLLVIETPSWLNVAFQCTITPLLVLGIASVAFRIERSPLARECGALAISCCFSLATVLAVSTSPPSTVILNLFLVSLPVVAVMFFARLRFACAVAFVAVTAMALAVVLMLRTDVPPAVRAYPLGFLLSASACALFGVHRLEQASRKMYLHGLLQTLQMEQLAFENGLLNRLSTTDVVTGAANRRQLDGVLQLLCAEPACGDFLLLADIDFFKRFNDRHGHLAGDACLREVVMAMRCHLGGTDLLARFGGEEFAIVLPRRSWHDAAAVAERIRAGVAAHDIEVNGRQECVTVSIGIAERVQGASLASLVAQADSALYEAKRSGRNCVRCAAHQPAVLHA